MKMVINEASRLRNINEYFFSVKLKQIAVMNSQGRDIINLGIGSPDLDPPQQVVEKLSVIASQHGAHGYQSYNGIPKFRKAIAEWYKNSYAVQVNPDTDILPLIGSKEGIMHISMAFLNSGDKVLIPNPGYPYTSVSNLMEAQILNYDLQETNKWEIELNQIQLLATSGIKIMWINYPHMPTGVSANKERIQKLIYLAKEYKFLIVNDNPYSTILTQKHFSIFQLEGAKEVCLELNSLSKSHNMAGWRLGWVIGRADYISAILKAKSNMDSGIFLGLQEAAAEALGVDSSWIHSINGEYEKRRAVVWKMLDLLRCTYNKNQAGLFIWAKVPTTAVDGRTYSDKILEAANVFITPGFIFGSNGNQFIRVSLCSSTTKLEEAFTRIKNSKLVSQI